MNAEQMYAVNFEELSDTIADIGPKITVLAEGDMGIGKTTVLKMLAKKLGSEYIPCYFDCTTKDLGDVTIPNIAKLDDGTGFVRYLTNEELGAHLDRPIILMIDEYGKANRAVKNALLRPMLERKIGSYTMHPKSIVFATTNKGAENVGDSLEAHQRNRIAVMRVRKPTAEEWIVNFALPNALHTAVVGFVNEFKQVLQSYEDVKNPADNVYIFHPQQERAAFITPRSLEAASIILQDGINMSDNAKYSALIGAIGRAGALDLMAFVQLANELPKLDDIRNSPETAIVPQGSSACVMTVSKIIGSMDKQLVGSAMAYLPRLRTEAQAMFIQTVIKQDYAFKREITTHAAFGKWARDNQFLFTADKI